MRKELQQRGKLAFGQIAKHNLLYSRATWWTYFSVAPIHYLLYKFLNYTQNLYMMNIIKLKGLEYFVAANVYVVEKKLGDWPEGPNLIITKMENLKRMWNEITILQKILKKIQCNQK